MGYSSFYDQFRKLSLYQNLGIIHQETGQYGQATSNTGSKVNTKVKKKSVCGQISPTGTEKTGIWRNTEHSKEGNVLQFLQPFGFKKIGKWDSIPVIWQLWILNLTKKVNRIINKNASLSPAVCRSGGGKLLPSESLPVGRERWWGRRRRSEHFDPEKSPWPESVIKKKQNSGITEHLQNES